MRIYSFSKHQVVDTDKLELMLAPRYSEIMINTMASQITGV